MNLRECGFERIFTSPFLIMDDFLLTTVRTPRPVSAVFYGCHEGFHIKFMWNEHGD